MNLPDLILALRDRLLASPRFHRIAAALPLTRPIARRRARALFDLCAGFVYSQVLLACVRLRLFEMLAAGPMDVVTLAHRLDMSIDAAERLLRAAAALDLVEGRSDGRFGLGRHGAALLAEPGISAMIEHHAMLYEDLRDPIALLRDPGAETRLSRYWSYARAHDEGGPPVDSVEGYTALMAASQSFIAREVMAAYPFARHRRLMDVGGGDGSFLRAVARHAPGLEIVLFDLPPVADIAARRFAEAGLSARARAVGGDFLHDRLPTGADVVTLVRVLHDHDDDTALTLLANVRRALPPGGHLIVAEPMAGIPGSKAAGDAYFGFYLLAMRSGRPRSADELVALATHAGFAEGRSIPTRIPMLAGLVHARVPNSASSVNIN